MEQRVGRGRIQVVIEFLIVLGLEFRRLARPGRMRVVDNQVAVGVMISAVFPLLFLAANDFNGQEAAVFAQQPFHAFFFRKILLFLAQIQNHVRTPFGAFGLGHREVGRARAAPAYRRRVFFVGSRHDFHLVAHHKGRVETKAEMPDDGLGVVLVFLHELLGAGERDLVDVLIHLLGRHTDAVVRNRQRAGLRVGRHGNAQAFDIALELARRSQRLQFLRGVHGI